MKWLLLVAGIFSNAGASLLIKVATSPTRSLTLREVSFEAVYVSKPLWLGLGLYGLTFIFYAASLARLPLNIVHPVFTSGAIVIVAVASTFILREPFRWTTGAGIVLIILGVSMITSQNEASLSQ